MHGGSSSFTYDNVFPNSLEPAHVSTFSSPPSSSSPELAFDVPNNISEINDSHVDWVMRTTCLIYLVGIMKLLSP